MFKIDFMFNNDSSGRYRKIYSNIEHATSEDFSYYLFHGDIVLTIDNCDFSTNWGWVPLLDFSSVAYSCMHDLKKIGHAEIDFTENDEMLKFKLVDNNVKVTATYVDCTVVSLEVV